MSVVAHDDERLVPGVVVDPPESSLPVVRNDIVVCSFYTDDDYYRAHAQSLRKALDHLGLEHEMEEIHKPEGADWADMTRRKIGFLAELCERNPDKKVFWIDVDCSLLSLPDYVANFTADLIGFQRGFSTPLRIGYAHRTRFWEPCFFGINVTPAGRRFIRDAHAVEQEMTVKATDDYFFEESWRANATRMTFQVLPSAARLDKADADSGVVPFFSFGDSGNVENFKDKVVQHKGVGGAAQQGKAVATRVPRRMLRTAKKVERALPASLSRPLRRVADQVGLTHLLTAGGAVGQTGSATAHRARLTRHMIAASQRGDVEAMHLAFERLQTGGLLTPGETAARSVADAFAHYVTLTPGQEALPLAWWVRPFPGNFGDWLSPFVVHGVSGQALRYVPPTAPSHSPHLVSVGSIGRFVKPQSVVVGTGVSSTDLELEPKARYVSVRGPVTAQLLRDTGGPDVESFGDPGALLRRIVPLERETDGTNGRTLLVRHFKHANVPLALPDDMDELGVRMSHPTAIEEFLRELVSYDAVVTSAMHVMIACHSYGIPCTLIGFTGLESAVHGSGIKYGDYSRGAGLARVHEPTIVGFDLRRVPVADLLVQERISDAKLDEIEEAIRTGVGLTLEDT